MEILSQYTAMSPLHSIQKQNGDNFASSIAKSVSGSRLINLKEDPSARAILGSLKADTAALTQAARNASVGKAFLNTVEGGLIQSTDTLVRMKELAVLAVNGSLSTQERKMANEEYQVMISQLDNIAERTKFNGNSLLGGNNSKFTEIPYIEYVSGDSICFDHQDTMCHYYDPRNGRPDEGEYTIEKNGDKFYLRDFKGDLLDIELDNRHTGAYHNYVTFFNGITISLNEDLPETASEKIRISYADIYAVGVNYVRIESQSSGESEASFDRFDQIYADYKLGQNYFFLDLQGKLNPENDTHLPYMIPSGTFGVYLENDADAEDGLMRIETHYPPIIEQYYPAKSFVYPVTPKIEDTQPSYKEVQTDNRDINFQFQIGENLNDYQTITLQDVSSVALGLKNTAILTSELGQAVQTQIERALTMIGQIQASIGSQQASMDLDITRIDKTREAFGDNEKAVGSADIEQEIAKIAESEALSNAGIMGEAKLNEKLTRTWLTLVS